jgi:hypothetical protein
MSFKNIRTFFESRLNETDSEFQRLETPFNIEDPGLNAFNKRFHIFYHALSGSVANQNATQDTVNAVVTLYFDGLRADVEALDNSFDLANVFRLACMNKKNLVNEKFLKKFVCTGMNATPLDTNENAIKITLAFSISMIFGTQANLEC